MDAPGRGEERRVGLYLAAVAVTLLAGYVLTLARVHTWDAIAYTASVNGSALGGHDYQSTERFHPQHLLFVPFAQGVRALLGLIGVESHDPFLPIQLMNALFGAAGAWLLGRIAWRRSGHVPTALAIATLYGMSNAVWMYSTDVDVMLPTLFFAILATWLSLGRSRGRWILVAVTAAAAVTMHQVAILFCASIPLIELAPGGGRDAVSRAVRLAIGIALLVVGAYVAVTAIALGLPLRDAAAWSVSASAPAELFSTPLRWTLINGARTFLNAFVAVNGLPPMRALVDDVRGLSLLVAAGVGSAGVLVMFLRVAVSIPRLVTSGAPLPRVCMVWLAFLVAFILWFQSDKLDHWIYAVPPVLLLTTEARLQPIRYGRFLSHLRWITWTFLVAVLWLNLAHGALPRRNEATARYAGAVEWTRRLAEPGDVVLYDGTDYRPIVHLAVPFFTGVDLIDFASTDVDEALHRVYDALARGHAVYITIEHAPLDLMVALELQGVTVGEPAADHPLAFRLDLADDDGASDHSRRPIQESP